MFIIMIILKHTSRIVKRFRTILFMCWQGFNLIKGMFAWQPIFQQNKNLVFLTFFRVYCRKRERLPQKSHFSSRLRIRSFYCGYCRETDWLKVWIYLTSPYSPDLALLNHCLFPNMTKWRTGKKSHLSHYLRTVTNTLFAELDRCYYSEGIIKREQGWTKYCSFLNRLFKPPS